MEETVSVQEPAAILTVKPDVHDQLFLLCYCDALFPYRWVFLVTVASSRQFERGAARGRVSAAAATSEREGCERELSQSPPPSA